jgi:hypothetical protein
MVNLNKGTPNEITLRVVLESGLHGREYFDHYDTIAELLAGHRRLVKAAVKEAAKDNIERIVAVAIVPADFYGGDDAETGYGFGLDELRDDETPA